MNLGRYVGAITILNMHGDRDCHIENCQQEQDHMWFLYTLLTLDFSIVP